MKKILFIIGLLTLSTNAGSNSSSKEQPITERDYSKSTAELKKQIDSLAVQIRLRLDLLNHENDENTAYHEEQY